MYGIHVLLKTILQFKTLFILQTETHGQKLMLKNDKQNNFSFSDFNSEELGLRISFVRLSCFLCISLIFAVEYILNIKEPVLLPIVLDPPTHPP